MSRPPSSTLFPYTTLFRSRPVAGSTAVMLRMAPPVLAPTISWVHLPTSLFWSEMSWPCVVVENAAEIAARDTERSEEHTSELQSRQYLVCRLLLEKKK